MENFSKKTLIYFIKLVRIFIKSRKLDNLFSKMLSIKFKKDRLEITTTIGCAMMCDYCPQTLIKSTLNKNNVETNRIMKFEDFKLYFEKISNKTVIHWSGYSEPLAHKDFAKFVNFLNEKNYEQHISTTMFGRRETEKFISTSKIFKSITFHLPDDSNLMKLKVTKIYLENLEAALRFQCSRLTKSLVYIVVFGKNFHSEVENLINKLKKEKIISNSSIDLRDHLHSRNGDVKDMEKFRMEKSNLTEKKITLKKDKLFYCSYGRLDQGVLLPNGDINLCCQDYSLNGIIGNLNEQDLKSIYKQDKIYKAGFACGEYNLCKKCEYYRFI